MATAYRNRAHRPVRRDNSILGKLKIKRYLNLDDGIRNGSRESHDPQMRSTNEAGSVTRDNVGRVTHLAADDLLATPPSTAAPYTVASSVSVWPHAVQNRMRQASSLPRFLEHPPSHEGHSVLLLRLDCGVYDPGQFQRAITEHGDDKSPRKPTFDAKPIDQSINPTSSPPAAAPLQTDTPRSPPTHSDSRPYPPSESASPHRRYRA
jgi:hypothetical protein